MHNPNLIPQPNNETEPYSHIDLSHSSLQEATPQPSSPPHLPENHIITPLAQALKPQTLLKDTSYNSNQTPTHKRKVSKQQLQKFAKRLKITVHTPEVVFSDSGIGEAILTSQRYQVLRGESFEIGCSNDDASIKNFSYSDASVTAEEAGLIKPPTSP